MLNFFVHVNQICGVFVLPYRFEPKPGLQTRNSGDESDSEGHSESSDEEITMCLRSKMIRSLKPKDI
jgi:hypothetical protein